MSLLTDEEIDKFASLFSTCPDITFISSINSQAVLNKIQRYGFHYYTPNGRNKCARKELGITGNEKAILIVIHHPFHWSLVMYWKQTNSIYHYDSMQSQANQERAMYVIHILQYLAVIPNTKSWIVPKHYPQQQSHWTCGYYVCFAIYILNHKQKVSPLSQKDIYTRFSTLFEQEENMDRILFELFFQETREPQRWNSFQIHTAVDVLL
jgi:Ulp1 family protease catalytic subunit